MRGFARLGVVLALLASLVGAGVTPATAASPVAAKASMPAAASPLDALAANATGPNAPVTPFIVGGQPATQTYGLVSIQNPVNNHVCGGVLLDEWWIISAWHCEFLFDPATVKIRVGSLNRSKGGELVGFTQALYHPAPPGQVDFDGGGDIALLKLSRKVKATPTSLALPGESGAPGTATRIAGWGVTCQDPTPECAELPLMLQQADTAVRPDADCSFQIDGMETFNGPAEICTIGAGGQYAMACFGDSGGAQVRYLRGKWRLTGTTSRDADDLLEHRENDCSTAPDGTPGKGVWQDTTYVGTSTNPGHFDWILKTLAQYDPPAATRVAKRLL